MRVEFTYGEAFGPARFPEFLDHVAKRMKLAFGDRAKAVVGLADGMACRVKVRIDDKVCENRFDSEHVEMGPEAWGVIASAIISAIQTDLEGGG